MRPPRSKEAREALTTTADNDQLRQVRDHCTAGGMDWDLWAQAPFRLQKRPNRGSSRVFCWPIMRSQ